MKILLSAARHSYRKRAARIRHFMDNQYGSYFYRSWTTMNLKDRADRVGLGRTYSAYRLLSLVTHGASPAVLGLQREIEGRMVIRTGPDLSSCIIAYYAGLDAFRETLKTIGSIRTTLDVAPAIGVVEQALKWWSEYRRAVRVVDKKIWPSAPPGRATTILAISKSGSKGGIGLIVICMQLSKLASQL